MKKINDFKINLQKVYSIYDKVGKIYQGTFYHFTDEDMIRKTLPSILMDFALRDIEIYQIGTFDQNTGVLTHVTHRKIKTDCYLFPFASCSPNGENLSLKDLDKNMKEIKNQSIANLQDKKEVVNE